MNIFLFASLKAPSLSLLFLATKGGSLTPSSLIPLSPWQRPEGDSFYWQRAEVTTPQQPWAHAQMRLYIYIYIQCMALTYIQPSQQSYSRNSSEAKPGGFMHQTVLGHENMVNYSVRIPQHWGHILTSWSIFVTSEKRGMQSQNITGHTHTMTRMHTTKHSRPWASHNTSTLIQQRCKNTMFSTFDNMAKEEKSSWATKLFLSNALGNCFDLWTTCTTTWNNQLIKTLWIILITLF